MSSQRIATLVGPAVLLALSQTASAAPPLSGAIFTTTVDGSIVNENVRYEAKEDVYLDGGPGPNAPSTAAGLPAGDYYFQVTDPSGKDLLSTDHITCRRIHVNDAGVIDMVYPGTNFSYVNGKDGGWESTVCQHAQGTDLDHTAEGAITVQLYPYDDTPNPGGVYKVWVTPVDDYDCDDGYIASAADRKTPVNNEGCSRFHGFIPAASKTDNYKVQQRGKPFDAPELTILKFHDKDNSGTLNTGDEEVKGWMVDVTDPLGVTNSVATAALIVAAEAGDYSADEENPTGTAHTFSYLDGALLGAIDPVKVTVAGDSGETHAIWFGNVGRGSIKVCKIFDKSADGIADAGEPPIAGWRFELYAGTDTGVSPVATGTAGYDGCHTFGDLAPGTYTALELIANGYTPTGATSVAKTIVSTLSGNGVDPQITGSSELATFTNVCEAPPVGFGTKGYWHNNNGIAELMTDLSVLGYVNSLDPYDSPTSYFDTGDEPFGDVYEVSAFLIENNATADAEGHREQLAQQLLAFIFNVHFRLGGVGAAIKLPDGTFVSTADLIDDAVVAWQSGTDAQRVAIKDLLDGFNNSSYVISIPASPCPLVFPTSG